MKWREPFFFWTVTHIPYSSCWVYDSDNLQLIHKVNALSNAIHFAKQFFIIAIMIITVTNWIRFLFWIKVKGTKGSSINVIIFKQERVEINKGWEKRYKTFPIFSDIGKIRFLILAFSDRSSQQLIQGQKCPFLALFL